MYNPSSYLLAWLPYSVVTCWRGESKVVFVAFQQHATLIVYTHFSLLLTHFWHKVLSVKILIHNERTNHIYFPHQQPFRVRRGGKKEEHSCSYVHVLTVFAHIDVRAAVHFEDLHPESKFALILIFVGESSVEQHRFRVMANYARIITQSI